MRKYLDRDRTIVNPEWLAARDEARKNLGDAAHDFMAFGHNVETYLPEQYGKHIPDEGAWVLVLDEPLTELRSRFRVPLLSMWRARRHELNSGRIKVSEGGFDFSLAPQQGVIATPGGDLHLWPHEYIIANDPLGLLSCEGAVIHSLGGETVLDEDHLFYLQSRGIPYSEAVLLLFEQITGTDFAYITFPEEVTEVFAGVGLPLWRHIADHPRSA